MFRTVLTGRVISVQHKTTEDNPKLKDNVLQVLLNVATGERKPEGEKYAPSVLAQFSLWGKYADSMAPHIDKDVRLLVDGSMGVPNSYVKDGEAKTTFTLARVDKVEIMGAVETEKPSEASGPAESETVAVEKRPKVTPDISFD
ncbi:hypothetical protein [Chroococcidiopsis sp.]|uniref:hypothetical protein n=1 Tax=Chroococcidiopsis sp. TaxID=3088168 RepID=UPI003F2D55A2